MNNLLDLIDNFLTTIQTTKNLSDKTITAYSSDLFTKGFLWPKYTYKIHPEPNRWKKTQR